MFKRLGMVMSLMVAVHAVAQDRSADVQKGIAAIDAVVSQHGGYEEIDRGLSALRAKVAEKMPPEDEFHQLEFEKMSFMPHLAHSAPMVEWEKTKSEEGAMGSVDAVLDFHRKLKEHGVDLIFVPVPSKIEAYPELFDPNYPKGRPVSPARLKMMRRLLEEGVEVVDALPHLLKAKNSQSLPVYEMRGHHPSGYGAKILGDLVAERLKRYDLKGRDRSRFSDAKRETNELGRPESPMIAFEVLMDGKPYEHVPQAEVVVIGDSNAYAFWTASWASHIARAAGVPVTDLSVSDGGFIAPARLAGLGLASLKTRKAVVWILASQSMARDGFVLADFETKPGLAGLFNARNYKEATARCLEWREQDPAKINVPESEFDNLGFSLLRTHMFEESEAVMTLWTTAYPNSADAWFGLAQVRMYSRNDAGAIEAFKKTLTLNPAEGLRTWTVKELARLGVDVEPVAEFELSDTEVDAIVGNYLIDESIPTNIFREGDILFFQMKDRPRYRMVAVTATSFSTYEDVDISFEPDDEGVMQIVAEFRGRRFQGPKVSPEPVTFSP